MMIFCKRIACTDFVEQGSKYCKNHIPKVCNFPATSSKPKCSQLAVSDLGLCRKHLNMAEKYIEAGKTTIEKLIEKRLVNRV